MTAIFDDVEFDIEMTSFDEFEELEEIDDEDFGGENFDDEDLFDDDEMDDELYEEDIWISPNTIFTCEDMPKLQIAAEICEDLWVPLPPSTYHAMAGATVICNPSASVETTTKESYRRSLVSNQSAKIVSGLYLCRCKEKENPHRMLSIPGIT